MNRREIAKKLTDAGFTEGMSKDEFQLLASGDVYFCAWFSGDEIAELWMENIETNVDFHFDVKTPIDDFIRMTKVFRNAHKSSLYVVSMETVEEDQLAEVTR